MPRYWFRQKTFGYGSTPNTWQGWLFTFAFVALLLGVVIGTNYVVADPVARNWVKGIGVIVLAVPFVWFVLAKTEPDQS
jgi:hypothetical protein